MHKMVLIFGMIALSNFARAQNYIVDTQKSPKAVMVPVGINEVKWTDGFWAERYYQTKETTLRKLWELAADPDAGHVLDNFWAAGTGEGEHAGTNWQDAWLYKWIEAVASIYKDTNSEWIEERMNEAIELIAAAQEEDGYIATQITAKFLGGVTVLKGQALNQEEKETFVTNNPQLSEKQTSSGWKEDELYRPFKASEVPNPVEGSVEVELIPYYAWANRGLAYMDVWIHLAR